VEKYGRAKQNTDENKTHELYMPDNRDKAPDTHNLSKTKANPKLYTKI
jgi:hypothetical protein